jgi:hypothetical protein
MEEEGKVEEGREAVERWRVKVGSLSLMVFCCCLGLSNQKVLQPNLKSQMKV